MIEWWEMKNDGLAEQLRVLARIILAHNGFDEQFGQITNQCDINVEELFWRDPVVRTKPSNPLLKYKLYSPASLIVSLFYSSKSRLGSSKSPSTMTGLSSGMKHQ